MKKYILLILLILVIGCSNKSIVGTWYYIQDGELITMTFKSDNTCDSNSLSDNMDCTYDDDTITTKTSDISITINYELHSDYVLLKAEKASIRLYDSEEKAKKYDEETKVEVPDVTNMTVTEAKKKLTESNLAIGLTISKEDEEIEKNHVIYTYPEKGRRVSKYSEVTIYYSLGPSYVVVEDYTGKNYFTIKNMLQEYGIDVKVEYLESDGSPYSSNIVSQSVKAGEKLEYGDSITLYIRK